MTAMTMRPTRKLLAYPLALALFAMISQVPSHWSPLADFLDRNRAAYVLIPLRAHVQKQLFHIRRVEHRIRKIDKAVITGSSAVINGVDGRLLSQLEVARGHLPVMNYGMTGLLGYELLMLKDDLAGTRTRKVVFGYNTFSFANRVHPDAVSYRWNTRDALALVHFDGTIADKVKTVASGLIGQLFDIALYHDFYREMALSWLKGTLRPMTYEFDYEPGIEPPPRMWPRSLATPAPMSNWYRAAYFDSEVRQDNMSYAALERFAELCRDRQVELILLAMPEPDFSPFGKWKQGVDPGAADRNVAAIAAEHHLVLIDRSHFTDLERDDLLWRDDIHLNERGRGIFTERLALLLSASL
jgi:hypothetical protein